MIITKNEKTILRFLAAKQELCSLNTLAKECNVSPAGAYKIVKKFEKEGIVTAKMVANIKTVTLDFNSDKTARVLELAFIPEKLEGRIFQRAKDLMLLKEVTKAGIIFGSYITKKEKPSDLDVLFILEKEKFEEYKQTLNTVINITPIKIQDIVQTEQDFIENLKRNDLIIVSALRSGIVLWGFDTLTKVLKNVKQ